MFDATQSSSSNVVLLPYIKNIKKTFGIDWPSVDWTDLTKPLYSALAARLYIQYRLRNNTRTLPRDVTDQASFWQTFYRQNGVVGDFTGPTTSLEKS